MIDEPRAAGAVPRQSALRGLARLVTETPWAMTGEDLQRARADGLDDAEVLQVIALAAIFGYLNRVADAVGIELDYEVAHVPPPPDPETPALPVPDRAEWPEPGEPSPLRLSQRSGAAELVQAWRQYVLERDAPLPRDLRTAIVAQVAARTGDAARARGHVDGALPAPVAAYVDLLALAPWRLGAAALAPLRAAGFDDDALFDLIATASFATFQSRVSAALAGLAR